MLLVSGATKTVGRISDPHLGVLLRPGNGNGPGEKPWAIDNGAFAGFIEADFRRLLTRCQGVPGCLWVAAPDVVADARQTLERFLTWEPILHELGFPVALVTQDGLLPRDVPWDSLEAVFVGGTDRHKLGAEARRVVDRAKQRGKQVHVGRVNSDERMKYCHDIGADSFDGGQFSMFSDLKIPPALALLRAWERVGRQCFFQLPEGFH
jgi:hypothetical protein